MDRREEVKLEQPDSKLFDGDGNNEERQKQVAADELLRLVCTEIARDGGASLVTSIKDNIPISNKRLNSLLYRSIGKSKLLTFLEQQNLAVFVDRSKTPHWVQLLPQGEEFHVDQASLNQCNKKAVEKLQDQVRNKALYVLQKRESKLNRRKKHNERSEFDTRSVNSAWLLSQSTVDFHTYLRLTGLYRSSIYSSSDNNATSCPSQVQPPGSRAWQDLVLGEFEAVLQNDEQSRFVIESNKTRLRQSRSDNPILDDEYLGQLVDILTKLLEQDGGHEVRLDLLLHRHKQLKNVLGGRDLKSIIDQYPKKFEDISIRHEDSDLVFETKNLKQGRLKVDEVGLYSVANTKWGNAIAKLMIHSSRSLGWDQNVVAVDLTASVGGMTLGLAKTGFFREVIAVEIDPDRARLCAENMKTHQVDHVVRVENADCMKAIPTLPKRACISLDPPWGGVRYKQNKEPLGSMKMGRWTFLQVLLKLYGHCTPCLVGMRLPAVHIKFVEELLDNLRKEGVVFDTKIMRHMSVQRFVVLHLRQKEEAS